MKTLQMSFFFLADGALKTDEAVVTSVQKQTKAATLYLQNLNTKKKINHSATAVGPHSPLTPIMIQGLFLFFFKLQYCWHQTLWGRKGLSHFQWFGPSVFSKYAHSVSIYILEDMETGCVTLVWQLYLEISWQTPLSGLCLISQRLHLLGFYSTL